MTDNEKNDDVYMKENPRVQKIIHLQEQIQKQREVEDFLMEKLSQEQNIIDELNRSVEESLTKNKEYKKYNEEMREIINTQVYSMHDITQDKLRGIKEYRSAYYRGCVLSLFFLSVALIILCGILHTFNSDICMFMAFFTAVQGALLTTDKKRPIVIDVLCKLLHLLLFPAMMVIFVCYELQYPEYGILLPYFTIAGITILILGVLTYFSYDPYRKDKKEIRRAENHISEIEKAAQKRVKKNQRKNENEEKMLLSKNKNEEKKQLRSTRRNEFKEKALQRISRKKKRNEESELEEVVMDLETLQDEMYLEHSQEEIDLEHLQEEINLDENNIDIDNDIEKN